jgi:hypothetical protein
MSNLSQKGIAVLGIGAVTPLGRSLPEIGRRLAEPPLLPGPRRVSEELLSDPSLSRNLRRADRFTRMAVMAATDAWKAAEKSLERTPPERIGIILSSGLGPHCRGFKFLDGMLDEGDSAASPTDFSHSVHGAACAYITALLDIRGPSLTLTDFESGFEQAVTLTQTWLNQGACDRVLLGAVEELGDVLLNCADRILGGSSQIAPGEGALFLLLGPAETTGQVTLLDPNALPQVDLANLKMTKPDALLRSFGYSSAATAFRWLGATVNTHDAKPD